MSVLSIKKYIPEIKRATQSESLFFIVLELEKLPFSIRERIGERVGDRGQKVQITLKID